MAVPQFLIEIPEERVGEFAKLIQGQGFTFDADMNLFAAPLENTDPNWPAHFGHHIPDLVSGLNRFLKSNDFSPEIRDNVEDWSYEQKADFLNLTVNEFTWYDFRVGRAWWRDDDRPWSELMEKYPAVPYNVAPWLN